MSLAALAAAHFGHPFAPEFTLGDVTVALSTPVRVTARRDGYTVTLRPDPPTGTVYQGVGPTIAAAEADAKAVRAECSGGTQLSLF